ncbi:ABC transporter ATP-binding protein [bacterium]|nr:ABC transporter ATP-binding protein [bacterium]
MKNSSNIVVFENVYFNFDDVVVLENINIKIKERDFLGVVGPNGCGKTTFLKLIIGLLSPTSGKISVFNSTPNSARKSIGYVSQHLVADLSFPLSVLDVVLMGRLGYPGFPGQYSKKDKELAISALEKVEMVDLKSRRFGNLSGGQRKRVLIARALASDPKLIIMDEPTESVDLKIRQEFYELLRKLNEKITIVISSHDLAFVSSYVNHVACLNRTLICHPTKELTGKMIEELYGGSIRMVEHDISCHPAKDGKKPHV